MMIKAYSEMSIKKSFFLTKTHIFFSANPYKQTSVYFRLHVASECWPARRIFRPCSVHTVFCQRFIITSSHKVRVKLMSAHGPAVSSCGAPDLTHSSLQKDVETSTQHRHMQFTAALIKPHSGDTWVNTETTTTHFRHRSNLIQLISELGGLLTRVGIRKCSSSTHIEAKTIWFPSPSD